MDLDLYMQMKMTCMQVDCREMYTAESMPIYIIFFLLVGILVFADIFYKDYKSKKSEENN